MSLTFPTTLVSLVPTVPSPSSALPSITRLSTSGVPTTTPVVTTEPASTGAVAVAGGPSFSRTDLTLISLFLLAVLVFNCVCSPCARRRRASGSASWLENKLGLGRRNGVEAGEHLEEGPPPVHDVIVTGRVMYAAHTGAEEGVGMTRAGIGDVLPEYEPRRDGDGDWEVELQQMRRASTQDGDGDGHATLVAGRLEDVDLADARMRGGFDGRPPDYA
ncbi:hypothetical protein HK101_006070 [Irineochytrium annulatum]|nr:hypothetical protein HK101_006070 [Irineochytrium annulatum]